MRRRAERLRRVIGVASCSTWISAGSSGECSPTGVSAIAVACLAPMHAFCTRALDNGLRGEPSPMNNFGKIALSIRVNVGLPDIQAAPLAKGTAAVHEFASANCHAGERVR